MCGIAAIFNYGSGPATEPNDMLRMREAMAVRGPDGAGYWRSPDGLVQMAHRRLALVELSEAGAQPMKSEDGSLVVSFNGEIYNHPELRAGLEREGVRFRTRSDTEVLLHLYASRGYAMVNSLRGMFAFVLWDSRRRQLLLGRDQFGIKPLYYSDDGRTFRAASQVKALLAGGGVDVSPEPAGHAGFFLWGHVPSPYTLYRGIRSLPAGTMLWVSREGVRREHTFCTASSLLTEAEASSKTETNHASPGSTFPARTHSARTSRARILRESLTETVRHHRVADVPVAIFLSAGLDSGTLAALAAQQGSPVETLTLGFEEFRGTAQDETLLAERVARNIGAQHRTVWIGQQEFQDCLGRFFHSMDQPSIDGLNSFLVSLAASRLGCKAALSGVGADELFGGYPGFRQIPRAVGWLGWCPRVQPVGRWLRAASARWWTRMGKPKYAGLFEYGGTWAGAYLLRRGLFLPWEVADLLPPELARDGCSELLELLQSDRSVANLSSPRLKVSCLEMSWYLRDRLLRDADWAGLANGVEIRTPYVDAQVVRKVAALSATNGGPSKLDVARACAPALPNEVLGRTKTGFSVPLGRGLGAGVQTGKPLRPALEARAWARLVYRQFVRR